MFNVVSRVTIGQRSQGRSKKMVFDFVTEFECEDGWTDLTNKARIRIPKKVYVRSESGRLVSIGDARKNIGAGDNALFMRGDTVRIEAGYQYRNNKGNFITEVNRLFEGFITQVGSKLPIEIEAEDNMWLLKQLPAKNKVYPSTTTVEDILREMLAGTPFSVNCLTQTTIGTFRTENETVAQVLERLRKDYRLEAYFRGSELRIGSIIYIEREARTESFAFQQNIISDELQYQRKDDITLSAIAHNTIETDTGRITRDGRRKTKKQRIEVLVTLKGGKTTVLVKDKGKDFPANLEGERRTFFFIGATTPDQLADLAKAELQKYYYTGLKGRFETFGLPLVRMGDNVRITDREIPDRNGMYKVKQVDYKGGTGGLRQTIHLDYKIQ